MAEPDGARVRATPAPLHRLVKRVGLLFTRPINAWLVRMLAAGAPERLGMSDPQSFDIARGLEARTAWIDRPHERGPTASVFWGKQELLRIDLFDGAPHIHYALAQMRVVASSSARIAMPEVRLADQIERAAFELRHNLYWCLQTHPSRQVRVIRLDDGDLDRATEALRRNLVDVAARHGRA